MGCTFAYIMRAALVTLTLVAACGSCYRLPKWKGDVDVSPLERAAVKTCGEGRLTTVGVDRITREPYLQSTTTTSTIVAWGTRDARGEVYVREPGSEDVKRFPASYVGNPAEEADRREEQHEDDEPIDAEDMYIVAARITGLEPGKLYCYQVLVDGTPLTESAPMTTASAPSSDDSVRFVAVGDVGTGGPAQEAIKKRMTEVPFELMLVLGDLAYKSGKPEQIHGNFFAVYKDVLRFVPVFPAIGNHELRTERGAPYFEAFVLPHEERYYSFDWGNVHFVAIDTNKRDREQLQWLDEDLRKNKLPWVIVFGHHPMYTNSLRGPQRGVREAFAKIFTDRNVDLVLTGHEHQYERFRVGGVNYVVSGGGGAQLTKFFGKQKSLKKATRHHYLSFEVSGTALTMNVIDINGNEIETVKLSKKPHDVKVRTDGEPDIRVTPVPPEKKVKPDERLHVPDDDSKHKHVPPPLDEPTPIPVDTPKPSTSAKR
jgi:predicted MPP superfamily phosphohydrolase